MVVRAAIRRVAAKKKGKGQVAALSHKVALIEEEVEERLLREDEVGEVLHKGVGREEVPTSLPTEA